MKPLIDKFRRSLEVSGENPELLKAQYLAFSRQMPLMYLILLSSTWAVAVTHMPVAPLWLSVGAPSILTIGCVMRIVHWWRSRHSEPTSFTALNVLRRTNRLAFVIAIAFTTWSFFLYPYGDAYARSHLAFYMAITVISCIFCLMHLRSAALTVTIIVNGAFIFFFAATGQPTFIATAINIALVSIGMLVILNINYATFSQMVTTQTEARRKQEEQGRLLRMIDDMPVAVMTVEPEDFTITYANETSKDLIRSIEHLLPLKADGLLGSSIDVFHRHPEHQRRILSDPKNLPHNARINLGPEVLDLKVSAIIADDGTYLGPMLTWAIVTKEVEAERQIRHLAHYDTLTGLANRVTFNENMDAALALPGDGPALLFVDLDGFKMVNDTRGHRVGDDLLREVANRLRAVCEEPSMTIGRLGGDEFAILVPHVETSALETFASRIIETLSLPYDQILIGASIGIAIAPIHGDTGEALLARADIALYAAKAAGKGTHRTFSEDMESRIQERVRLRAKLRTSLATRQGMFVFYQPIIDAHTKKITAREALVRWHHPERGWISPAEFVPIAEESGLIDQLGEFVLNTACFDAAGWSDAARVAVNVSAAQLGKGTITSTILAALARSGLSPDRLEIEVTETAMLDDENGAIGDLRRIRDMGVRVALDDFGTGYSSLTHLRAFPFDKIKIDGSFVKDAVERPESAAIVRAIADLGKRLGVTTVAEGVETEAHLIRVLEEGCTEVQGYFYGKPVPSERDAGAIAELNHRKVKTA
ncbi:putative bifunctional diguanylate cyclase/phosphodiesterase (plasmid) [Agrobacterium rosae]|uniref:EAL domain-containing protein n=1 Tax=Agrobacterium rosae TaxID=1972867 RepID=A0ABU4W5A5_9HYPH|nr:MULTISPECIES: EAL domain-containing protein [Agrobacterium]MDX8311686.1 EAL domain-containing protein [Agrobacterium sp. rho-13.3]MDX8332636.1 EAL domain-containing protein [Agrobacterium rosae]